MNFADVLVACQAGSLAGIMTILSTLLVEKLGGRIGGVIASMPITILPASYTIIESAKSEANYLASLCSLPLNCFGGIVFLEVWKILPKYLSKEWSFKCRLTTLIIVSLSLWSCLVICCTLFFFEVKQHPSYMLPTAVCSWLIHLCLGLSLSYNLPRSKKGHNPISFFTYICRGGVAFLAIACGSLIARLGNSLFATVVSMFPAILLATMVSMWISQGEDVGLGAAGPLMVGGNAWAFYGVIISFIRYYTNIPTIFVIIISCLCSIICISIPCSFYLSWREKKSNPDIKSEIEMKKLDEKIVNIKEEEKNNNDGNNNKNNEIKENKKLEDKVEDVEKEKSIIIITEKTTLIEK